MTVNLNQLKNGQSEIWERLVGVESGKGGCFLGIYLSWRSGGAFMRGYQGGQLIIQGYSSKESWRQIWESGEKEMIKGLHVVGIQ